MSNQNKLATFLMAKMFLKNMKTVLQYIGVFLSYPLIFLTLIGVGCIVPAAIVFHFHSFFFLGSNALTGLLVLVCYKFVFKVNLWTEPYIWYTSVFKEKNPMHPITDFKSWSLEFLFQYLISFSFIFLGLFYLFVSLSKAVIFLFMGITRIPQKWMNKCQTILDNNPDELVNYERKNLNKNLTITAVPPKSKRL